MAMSKKDFIALADALRPVLDGVYTNRDIRILDALCAFMRGQNPNFMESRWRDYLAGECGPSGGKVKKASVSSIHHTSANAPKTGEPCGCRRGQERDNCPACEGTGARIDYAAIRRQRAR